MKLHIDRMLETLRLDNALFPSFYNNVTNAA